MHLIAGRGIPGVAPAFAVQYHRGAAGLVFKAGEDGRVGGVLLDFDRVPLLVGGGPHLHAVLAALLVQGHGRLGASGGAAGELDTGGVGRQGRDACPDSVVGGGGAAVQVRHPVDQL